MNIDKYVTSLSKTAARELKFCVSRMDAGKWLKHTEVERIFDEHNASGAATARVLGMSVQAIHKWVSDGCPVNSDKTYDIPKVYRWRLDRAEHASAGGENGGLKEEKLKKEIEFLQARIEEKKDLYVERSLHETIMVSRAGSLRTFLEKTFMANAVHLAGKTPDEIRTLLYSFIKAMMEAYTGGDAE